jgi:hypothetical protein
VKWADLRNWALHSTVSPLAAHVFWCLMLHADSDLRAHPSVVTIAAECHLNRNSARRALRELEAAGEIVKVGVIGNNVVIYELVKPALMARAGLSQARANPHTSPRKNGSKPAHPARQKELEGVLKGDAASPDVVPSAAESIRGAREELRRAGIRQR